MGATMGGTYPSYISEAQMKVNTICFSETDLDNILPLSTSDQPELLHMFQTQILSKFPFIFNICYSKVKVREIILRGFKFSLSHTNANADDVPLFSYKVKYLYYHVTAINITYIVQLLIILQYVGNYIYIYLFFFSFRPPRPVTGIVLLYFLRALQSAHNHCYSCTYIKFTVCSTSIISSTPGDMSFRRGILLSRLSTKLRWG
jgi:hypothetical protein